MKSWIVVAILIVVAVIVYYAFFSGSSVGDSATLQEQSDEDIVGIETLSLLNQIQSLRIDKSVFQSAAYQSLEDYTVQIPPVNIGRPNPFAPLSSVGFSASSSVSR
ncbi:MAG: hypothetical protein NTZ38_03265 [Candidatus Taylorbacteria bacterium]|nr:hypothetical protein [Candidatus Taylorbacteria bacterium]